MQSISLDNRRRTASRILAAAALELFPDTLLVEGGDTPLGFYYEFLFPFEFKKEFLTLLEEKMRQICKEERPVQILEMVPKNAAEFLIHHRHEIRAESAKEIPDTLTEVFKMGSFVDLCQGGAGESSSDAGAFKLQEVHFVEGVTRILGTAFSDKQELKTFLKKKKDLPGLDHQQLGKNLSLFTRTEKGWIWYPRGEFIRELILRFWKEEHIKQNFHIINSFPSDIKLSHLEYHRQTKCRRVAEYGYQKIFEKGETHTGLFESTPYLADYAHIFCKAWELPEDVISSLQFIVKISKIFNFEVDVVQCPSWKKKEDEELTLILASAGLHAQKDQRREKSDYPTVELKTEDALGRKWIISFLKVNFQEKVIMRSSFVSLERLIALLLEQSKGDLPVWLAPEQLRVVAITESVVAEAHRVHALLQAEGFRSRLDCQIEKLGKRMHNALQEKVPYCILIGEKEHSEKKVTLRDNRLETEKCMSFEDVLQQLHAMNRKTRLEN